MALVALLDHLPLAIELAAARVRVMTPRTLLDRMSQRFRLLATNDGRVSRHATLRATLDWSWELLSEDEQQALAQVSLFESGFSSDAVAEVLSLASMSPVDAVLQLVSKSLVRKVAEDRFDLLVSVQSYASERLEQLGGHAAVEERHGRYYASLGEHGADPRTVALDIDNMVAACRAAAKRGDKDVAVATLKAAWTVLDLQGPPALAVELAKVVGDLPGLAPGLADRLHAEALLAQGEHVQGQLELRRSLLRLGKPEATSMPGVATRVLSGVAVQLVRRLGLAPRRVRGKLEVVMSATRAYQRLVETYWFSCDPPRMLASAISALNLCEPAGPSPELSRAYATLALAASGLGLGRTADRYAKLALTSAERTGAPLAEAYVRFLACVYRIGHARWDEVDRDLEKAITLFEAAEDHRLLGDAITVDGMSALYRGDFARASQRFSTVFRQGRAGGNAQHQVWGALGDAEAQLRQGHVEEAHGRIEDAMAVLEDFPSPMEIARAWGLKARVELERAEREAAQASAHSAAEHLRGLGPPTAHYLLEGYAGAHEVLLLLEQPDAKARKLMATYAGSFPIGRPRQAWLTAKGLQHRGRLGRARKVALAGITTADELGMPYERQRLEALVEELR